MSEAAVQLSFEVTPFDDGAARVARLRDDRRFHLWLAVTFFVHLVLLIGFNAVEPRRLGAPGGADDAISVSIITEADLRGNATVDDRAAGQPVPAAPPVEATKPASPAEPQPQQATPPLPEPQTAPQPETPVRDAAKEPVAEPPAAPPEEPALQPTPELLALPDPSERPAPKASDAKPAKSVEAEAQARKPEEKSETAPKPKEVKPATPKPQQQQTAKLDLTPPAVFAAPVGGGGAGVQRPAGITRSGENDAFARGVIRALQTTMPQLRETRGRVTVRITLDMNGGLVNTEVLKPSNVAGLDQSVVFATRQSSFPFPPHNAKPVDLVFIVTYIYR